MTGSERFPSIGLTLLDSHLGVAKTYQFRLVALFSDNYKLFSGVVGRPFRLVVATYARTR